MKFEVYCDESYPDLLLSKKPTGKFLVIGSLWLESGIRKDLKELIHRLREQHKIGQNLNGTRSILIESIFI